MQMKWPGPLSGRHHHQPASQFARADGLADRAEARIEAAGVLLEINKPAGAAKRLQAYLTEHPRNRPREAEVLVMLAETRQRLGENDVALELLRLVMMNRKSTPSAVKARYLLQRWSR